MNTGVKVFLNGYVTIEENGYTYVGNKNQTLKAERAT